MIYALYDNNDVVLRTQNFDEEPVQPNPVKGLRWELYQTPPVPAKSPEQVAQETTWAIQHLLDSKAREYRYDSIHTACGWADKFADASALKNWGAAVWTKAKEIENDVLNGIRPLPSADEVLTELPVFVEN